MYQDNALISVLMSVYNGAKTLEKAIDSILRQTHRNLEFIICDDASTDETWEILQKYQKQDARVQCFRNDENLGLGPALNRCLDRASGAYIARQDADDISDPERLEKTLRFLLESSAPYVGCGVRVFDDGGVWSMRIFQEKITRHIIAQKNPFFHPTMVFHRYVFDRVGGYSEDGKTRRVEDYDLVMRLAAMGLIGNNLPEVLYSVYEPTDAYLRRTRKARLHELRVRWHGLRAMKMPITDYIYLLKPVIMLFIPKCMQRWIKRIQWNILLKDKNIYEDSTRGKSSKS